MQFYDRIKARRIELNMSQDELAAKIGYNGRSMVCHIEKGETDISISKLTQIAAALDISPMFLLYGNKELLLDDTEKEVIENYRLADAGTRSAVNKLLDIREKDSISKAI